jgi:hypothetical protein
MTTVSRLARSFWPAVVLPVLVYTGWLVISRLLLSPTGAQDWLALGVSLATGSFFVWRLPWTTPLVGRLGWTTPRPSQAVAVYLALGILLLSLYTRAFLHVFFGER